MREGLASAHTVHCHDCKVAVMTAKAYQALWIAFNFAGSCLLRPMSAMNSTQLCSSSLHPQHLLQCCPDKLTSKSMQAQQDGGFGAKVGLMRLVPPVKADGPAIWCCD